MEPGGGAVAASPRPITGSAVAVAFSWEQEPGVSKQSTSEAKKPTAGAPGAGPPRRAEAVSRRTPPSAAAAKSKKPPATTTAPVTAEHRHWLRVPPPPGGPGNGSKGRTRSRGGVRPRDDPFLAAYLACTDDGGSRGGRGAQRMLGWAGIGLGLGLGLSCKSSCSGAVEECVVRLAKIPELRDED